MIPAHHTTIPPMFTVLAMPTITPDQLLVQIEALQARADARKGKPGYAAILHRLRAARIAALAVKA